MTTQFPPSEFNDWAANYDSSTASGTDFPFDGYTRVLQTIADLAGPQPGDSVLDLGIGTGNLALLFARKSCGIWGVDFSSEMLALAKLKLPEAQLVCQDLRTPMPITFERRFDHIVSAYTFHHFPLEEKVTLVKSLLEKYLLPGGNLVIGDIAFQSAAEEAVLRDCLGKDWEQEYYWLADETIQAFLSVRVKVKYCQVSSCTCVFQFEEE